MHKVFEKNPSMHHPRIQEWNFKEKNFKNTNEQNFYNHEQKVQKHTWSTTFQKHLFPKIQKQFTREKSQDHTWAKFHKLAMFLQNFAQKITMGKIKGNNFVTIRNGVKGIGMELLRVAIDIVEIKGIQITHKEVGFVDRREEA